VRLLLPLVTPPLMVAFLEGGSVGSGFFDFISRNTDLRKKILEIAPKLPFKDRLIFEHIDELAAEEKRSVPKRKKHARRGRR
jgi:hypothetical protein